jgi:nucleoside-diphosphate-sugar epimerase
VNEKQGREMVLITGATGFIGSHLVHHLLALNEQSFYVLTRRTQPQHHLLEHERINVITGNISEKVVLPKDVTTIYHCAGVISNEDKMWRVNVEGTRNVAEAAFNGNCRIIHLSSAGVVGVSSRCHIDESVECKPRNLYERTKWEAERIIKGYVEKGLSAQILRPTIVVGAGRDPGQDSFLQLIRSIKNGRYANIDGGSGIYNIIHVDEVARAMKALDNDRVSNGEAFFVNTPISYKELSEIVIDETGARKIRARNVPYCVALTMTMVMSAVTLATGKKMPLTYSRLQALVNQKMFSQNKLSEMTGYKTAMPIQEYVRQMYHIFAEKGWLDN